MPFALVGETWSCLEGGGRSGLGSGAECRKGQASSRMAFSEKVVELGFGRIAFYCDSTPVQHRLNLLLLRFHEGETGDGTRRIDQYPSAPFDSVVFVRLIFRIENHPPANGVSLQKRSECFIFFVGDPDKVDRLACELFYEAVPDGNRLRVGGYGAQKLQDCVWPVRLCGPAEPGLEATIFVQARLGARSPALTVAVGLSNMLVMATANTAIRIPIAMQFPLDPTLR